MTNLDLIVNRVNRADNVVFITGAGVSTDAGIPDFRSKQKMTMMGMESSQILSTEGWRKYPLIAYDFLESLNVRDAVPTIAHKFIKETMNSGKNVTIITQNLDLLHEKSGVSSDRIIHIHGTFGYCCSACRVTTEVNKENLTRSGNFKIDCCNSGTGRPLALLYGEQYDKILMDDAKSAVRKADLVVAMGTGLDIIPIRDLFFSGNHEKLFINRDPIENVDMKFIISRKKTHSSKMTESF